MTKRPSYLFIVVFSSRFLFHFQVKHDKGDIGWYSVESCCETYSSTGCSHDFHSFFSAFLAGRSEKIADCDIVDDLL